MIDLAILGFDILAWFGVRLLAKACVVDTAKARITFYGVWFCLLVVTNIIIRELL